MVLKNLERLEMVDNRTKDFFAYTRVGNRFYLKLDKMTYKEGKEACHKMYGNMLEFDERTNGYVVKLVDMISNFEIWNFMKNHYVYCFYAFLSELSWSCANHLKNLILFFGFS